MAVSLPCYSTREQVKRALDLQETSRTNSQIDRANESAAENIEGQLHRKFYFVDDTRKYDWPNFQRAYPWRIWFDASELADVTVNVPVVTSGGVVIPAANILWGPWNYAPPFTFLELNRSTVSSFGVGTTPQQDVKIQGTFGYWLKTAAAGALAAAMSDTTSLTLTVTNGGIVGVGDIIIVGSERMLVSDRSLVDSTFAQSGSGCSTASAADATLTTTGGTFFIDEILVLDAERMLIVDSLGSNKYVVKRAFDGTALATHSAAEIFTARQLTVLARGDFGSTAATHLNAAAIVKNLPPALVRDLSLAEATNQLLQETSGYARTVGGPDTAMPAPGVALADKWDETLARHGRKVRMRAI